MHRNWITHTLLSGSHSLLVTRNKPDVLDEWIVTQTVLQLCYGMSWNSNNEWTIDWDNGIDEFPNNWVAKKKPVPKDNMQLNLYNNLEIMELEKRTDR